jgi:hypothetical protein
VTLLRDPEVAGFDFADRKRALVAKGLLRREVYIYMVLALSLSISLRALSLSLFLSAVLTGFTFASKQVEEAFRRVEEEDAEGTLQDVQTMSRSLRGRSSSRPGSASRVTDDSVEPRKRKTQAEIQSIKLRLRKKKELKQKTTGAKKRKNLSMCALLCSISLFLFGMEFLTSVSLTLH